MSMAKKSIYTFSLMTALACCPSVATSAEPKPQNLLLLKEVRAEDAGVAAGKSEQLKELTDGKPATTALLQTAGDAPVTVVYGFGDKTVAPEKLIVTLPSAGDDAQWPERVELLVSTLSAHAGFQSVRVDPLDSVAKPQEFKFNPVAARWVMLRFTPAAGAKQIAVAEVVLFGFEGAPVTRYQFKEAPAKAFDVLKRLKGASSLDISISQDEASLFEDAADGKLDQWTFAEAALLASGVVDAQTRQNQLKRLDALEEQARQEIAQGKTPFEQGQLLLKFLHAGPMSKGYVSQQTDLSTILEKGTFNCVSSATMYNVLGSRLGFDVRAIEVPHHAFSILYDGADHADVETTTAHGFNPSRDKKAQDEFTKLTGFAYIPDSNRDERREVREVGLAAIICYNHGVELMQAKRYHEALLAYFRAMSLDHEFDSAVKNALAVLANWSVELSREKKHEQALNVIQTGLDLAPHDAALVNNHKAVWGQWAEMLMSDGKNDEALAVLRRAHEALPEGNFEKMQAWVFIRPGEEHIKKNEWDQAFAVASPGLEKLTGEPRKELAEWADNLYLRWSYAEIRDHRFDKAITVLQRALAEKPEDARLANQLAYAVQEWGWETYKTAGAEKAQEQLGELYGRFNTYQEVKDVAAGVHQRIIRDLSDKTKYDDALVAARRAGKLLNDPEKAAELVRFAVDNRAQAHLKKNEWQAAIDAYADALRQFPKDQHLENNLQAAWDQWANSFSKKRDWAGALDVYEKSLAQLADPSGTENNIAYSVQEWTKDAFAKQGSEAAEKILAEQVKRFPAVKALADVGAGYYQRAVSDLSAKEKYDDALAVVERAQKVLKDDEAASMASIIYDAWSDKHARKKEWQAAVDVYSGALKKFPKNTAIQQNAAAAWYQWAKTYMDKKDWAGAIKVYEDALKVLPDNSVLKNNLEYCKQQRDKNKK